MRPTVFIAIIAFLALVAGDANAQEQNIPLSVEGSNVELQRTPSLVVHEVVTPQPTKALAPSTAKNTTAPIAIIVFITTSFTKSKFF